MALLFWLQKNIFGVIVASAIFLGFSFAYVAATMGSLLLPDSIAVTTQSRSKTKTTLVPRTKPYEEYEEIILGNLFQSQRAMSGEGAPVNAQDIILHGVLAGARSFARAIIQIKGEADIREYATDDSPGGNRIMAIYGNSVLLDRGGPTVEVAVGQDTSALPTPSAPAADTGAIPGAKRVVVPRSRMLALTKDPTALAQTKMAPVTVGDKIAGLKLVFVPNESVFFELGARSGDIIRRLNGSPLENQERLMEFYMGLKTVDHISVEVERGGKILPFEIVIQN